MTREEDIWTCKECESMQGKHDQYFEGSCEECHEEKFNLKAKKRVTKKQLGKAIEKLFKELGLKLTESDLVSSLNYEAPSRIGTFYTGFKVDKDNIWLFGNFLGNEEAAKKEFGHWKRNLMIERGQLSIDNILGRIEMYLTFIR